MIKFEGIIISKEISIIKFSNEQGSIVEIPIDSSVAKRISLYLAKISTPGKPVERENEDDSE